jgi:hypothetical protein
MAVVIMQLQDHQVLCQGFGKTCMITTVLASPLGEPA